MKYIKLAILILVNDVFLLFRKCCGCNISFSLVNLISPRATIKTKGKSKVTIGRQSTMRRNSELSATNAIISIGEKVFINRNCMIVAHKQIDIGDGTTIGPGVYIYDHDHDMKGGYVTQQVCIGKNVWIGAACIILKGVTIGDGAVVGAGTIVTKNIPTNAVVYQKRNTTTLKGEYYNESVLLH